MQKIIIFVSFIALATAGILDVQKDNDELFKYSPSDVYTLSEDVDDDKPPTVFNGEIKTAKTELFENLNSGKKFKLQVKTQNGIDIQQVGKLKDEKTFVVSGHYSFTGADGKRYKTRYTADEFGYHPKTELDLDIPEAIPSAPVKQNPFKFLNQNFNGADFFNRQQSAGIINPNLLAPAPTELSAAGPLKGSGQSGDDYSYQGEGQSQDQDQGYGQGLGLGQGFGQGLGQGQGNVNYGLSGQSGVDYSIQNQDNVDHRLNGYDYIPPTRVYLPAQLEQTQYNSPYYV